MIGRGLYRRVYCEEEVMHMKWRWMIVVVTIIVLAVLVMVLVGCGGVEAFGLLQQVGR